MSMAVRFSFLSFERVHCYLVTMLPSISDALSHIHRLIDSRTGVDSPIQHPDAIESSSSSSACRRLRLFNVHIDM